MTERKKLPLTKEMVQHILLENESHKGISLRRIYQCIEEKYTIEITARRKSLTKKYVTDLISKNMLKNVTGKGLNGSLVLMNKKKFLQNLKPQKVSVKLNKAKKPTKGKSGHRPDNEQNQQEENSDNEEVQQEQQQQQSQLSTAINNDKRNARNAKTKGSQKIKGSKRKRQEDNRIEEEEEDEGDEVDQQQQQQQQSQLYTAINNDKRNAQNSKTKGSQKIKGSKRKRQQDNRYEEEEEEDDDDEDDEVDQQQQQQQQQGTISMFDTPLEYYHPTTSTPYSLRNRVAPTAPVRKNRTKKRTPPISYIETPRVSGRVKKIKLMEQIDETIY